MKLCLPPVSKILWPWRNGATEGAISEGVNSPHVHEVVLGTVPDFIDFRIHFQLFYGNCDALLRGLSGRDFHSQQRNSRLSAKGSCFSHHSQRLCQTFLLQSSLWKKVEF